MQKNIRDEPKLSREQRKSGYANTNAGGLFVVVVFVVVVIAVVVVVFNDDDDVCLCCLRLV